MKVEHIELSKLNGKGYFQYMTEVKLLIETQTAAALKIASRYEVFLQRYNKMDAAFKKITKSAITEHIRRADKARDEVWVSLTETNRAAMRHFDPQVQEAARRINIVVKTYGKVARNKFNEETASITNILQEFEGQYTSDIAKVGLGPLVIELKARNIAFANLVRDRFSEEKTKVKAAMKKARAALDEIYYEIIEFVNSLAVVEGLAGYKDFMESLNVIIAEYKLLMPKRSKKGKKEAGDAQTNGGSDD